MYIVGIDIAKRKHEAAVIDGEGAVIIKPFSFTNNCSGYNRLLAMLAKAKLPLDEVSFAMEATGHYWLALFTRLQKEGFRVQVINPVQTNSIRSFYIRQAKTDPRDALLIAEVIRFGHFSESTLHPENIYELRELCRGRHAIWLAASSAVLHDPALKLYFQKKRDEGKPYMASVGHACRKMVSIIYAVMRDNKAYTPYIPNEISA